MEQKHEMAEAVARKLALTPINELTRNDLVEAAELIVELQNSVDKLLDMRGSGSLGR
jgi:hypothetical protein